MRLIRDERGLIGIIGIVIIGIIALFGFSAAAAINWKFIIALFAMGIIGIAFIGVVFFKADFKMVIYAALASFGILVIIEITMPVLVGAALVLGALYYFKVLIPKRPLIFFLLVVTGLIVMVWGYAAIILPMGVYP